ncbi:MAG TPA: hypothetical protein VFT79_07815 [Solirubrobacterales bacterium]|nr:hypothetical protein [Solirubrobacterales bacterium]
MTGTPPNSAPPPGGKPLWGSYGAGGAVAPSRAAQAAPGAPQGPGGEQPDRLTRQLMGGVRVLALLLILVLVNAFVNKPEEGEEPLELNPVAAAAERVEKNSGGRLSLYVVYSTPAFPRPIVASGGGVYNEETDRSRITLEVSNPVNGASVEFVQIEDGEVSYEGGNAVEAELPPGKEWVRTDKSEEPEEDETPLNMEESLQMLDSPERFEVLGRESINGKMARHYRGEVKLEDLVDVLREKGKDTEADAYERIAGESPTEIRAEAWVDRKNLLRRLRMVMPMPGEPGEPLMTIDMRMDFFDYGAKPEIKIPDADSVVEGPIEDDEGAPSSSSIS